MPPGFINATTAPPVSEDTVAQSWASAMTSPRADSPAALGVRDASSVMVPIGALARGAESTLPTKLQNFC
jgi:hypothetical protein